MHAIYILVIGLPRSVLWLFINDNKSEIRFVYFSFVIMLLHHQIILYILKHTIIICILYINNEHLVYHIYTNLISILFQIF